MTLISSLPKTNLSGSWDCENASSIHYNTDHFFPNKILPALDPLQHRPLLPEQDSPSSRSTTTQTTSSRTRFSQLSIHYNTDYFFPNKILPALNPLQHRPLLPEQDSPSSRSTTTQTTSSRTRFSQLSIHYNTDHFFPNKILPALNPLQHRLLLPEQDSPSSQSTTTQTTSSRTRFSQLSIMLSPLWEFSSTLSYFSPSTYDTRYWELPLSPLFS